MADKLPRYSEVDAEDIQRLTFEQLSTEHQKALDDIKKKIREEKEQKIQKQEEESMKHYMLHLSVDGQGKVTKLKDVTFNSSQFEVKTNESKLPALDTEIANMVDSIVFAHLNNKLNFVSQNIHRCLTIILAE